MPVDVAMLWFRSIDVIDKADAALFVLWLPLLTER
jgi:hypothetical protein